MIYLKKKNLVVVVSLAVLTIFFLFLNSSSELADPKPLDPSYKKSPAKPILQKDSVDELGSIQLEPFMPQMANETLKAELGRATWRLFHTILARYPEEPTTSQRETLSQYIQLFVKVYPCGDCARHFSKLLEKYPPQLNNRQIASVWGCHIHNKVNERLNKPEYDCTTILTDYDCGCGADEEQEQQTLELDSVDTEHLAYELKKEEKQLG